MRRILALAMLALFVACAQPADEDAQPTDADTPQQTDGAAPDREGPQVTVGSGDFTESIVLAEIYAQGLEAEGFDVAKKLNIGSREVYYPALESGEIDLIPEYTGSLLSYITKQKKTASPDSQQTYDDVTAELEGKDVSLLEMSDAQDKDAIVVNKETAEEFDLTKISDLQPHASELVMGGPPECPKRQACLKGLQDVYDIGFKEFKPLDVAGPLTVQALKSNEIQVANLFTTQSAIPANDFVVLEDDKGPIVGAENVVPAVNTDAIEGQDDEFADVVNAITAKLTTEGLLELNGRVDNDQEDAEDVAADWLADQDLA